MPTPGQTAYPVPAPAGSASDLSLTGQAEGDLAVFNGSAWEVLPPGADGTVLTSAGAGEVPAWEAASSGTSDIIDPGLHILPRLAAENFTVPEATDNAAGRPSGAVASVWIGGEVYKRMNAGDAFNGSSFGGWIAPSSTACFYTTSTAAYEYIQKIKLPASLAKLAECRLGFLDTGFTSFSNNAAPTDRSFLSVHFDETGIYVSTTGSGVHSETALTGVTWADWAGKTIAFKMTWDGSASTWTCCIAEINETTGVIGAYSTPTVKTTNLPATSVVMRPQVELLQGNEPGVAQQCHIGPGKITFGFP